GPAVGKLRGELHLVRPPPVQPDRAGRPRTAAEQPGRRPDRAVALERIAGAVEELDLAHRPEPAAPPARSTAILEQLVAGNAQRQVGLDVLDRVVARVRIQGVDRVETVL